MKRLSLAAAVVVASASGAIAADRTLLVCDLYTGVPCFTLKTESDTACVTAGKAVKEELPESSTAKAWCIDTLSGKVDEVKLLDSELP